jgi:hypothetical protein
MLFVCVVALFVAFRLMPRLSRILLVSLFMRRVLDMARWHVSG